MSERGRGLQDDLEADTRQVPSYDRLTLPSRLPTLTIAYHPRLTRIGERVRMLELAKKGRRAAISRLEPEFQPPHGTQAALPLASSFLSRRPITITSESDGSFTVDARETTTALVLDGTVIEGTYNVSKTAIERGVVLELAGQVVLLFHLTAEPSGKTERHGLIGESDAIIAVRKTIDRVAKVPAPVLVRGETGTGKELVARAVHAASSRSDRPYLTVNMAAIPSTLAASELFGHTKGAFSGAKHSNDGFFGRADGGTLFMDEVGDTPSEVQAALLRVLETGEVQQIGAERIRKVDVRLIAATDAEIEKEVEAGRFRAPLFYRLANQEVRLAPLRERRDDVGRLLLHFLGLELEAAGRKEQLLSTNAQGMSWLPAPIAARLVRYDWPGNVRQLRNVARYLASVEHAEVLPLDDPQLNRLMPLARPGVETQRHDARELRAVVASHMGAASAEAADDAQRRSPSEIGDDELATLMKAKQFKLGNVAKALGISRPALNDLIDAHPTLRRANNIPEDELAALLGEHDGDVDAIAKRLCVSKRALALRLRQLDLI